MHRMIIELLVDDYAISSLEYTLILALIGAGLVAACLALGDQVLADYQGAAGELAGV